MGAIALAQAPGPCSRLRTGGLVSAGKPESAYDSLMASLAPAQAPGPIRRYWWGRHGPK